MPNDLEPSGSPLPSGEDGAQAGGPMQGLGQFFDGLFKHIPKKILGALATALVFSAALRFEPSLPEPYLQVYRWVMLIGMAGAMFLTLWKLARER